MSIKATVESWSPMRPVSFEWEGDWTIKPEEAREDKAARPLGSKGSSGVTHRSSSGCSSKHLCSSCPLTSQGNKSQPFREKTPEMLTGRAVNTHLIVPTHPIHVTTP
jgi:hypothetical protein